MAIANKSNLYSGEDWRMVYEAFREINLQAYDFQTIRSSMVSWIRTQYGDDSYNSWIENDEFLFILDTVAFLGQNLAFRMDLNSRESFLDTAERRSSVLKLAKMISYSPRRAYPARAIAKVTEISTNQDIRNSSGESLKGIPVRWNDAVDPNWYENFILIMNSVFLSTNQYGDPIKKIVDSTSITNSIYRMNTIPMSYPSIPFTSVVNGESMSFEVVNPDLNSIGVLEERHPEPQMQQHILYRNDGNGFESPNTGFFVYFKQGNLTFSDYSYSDAIENRTQIVPRDNINETDVWVQEITDDGIIRTKWTRVPGMESVAYTSTDRSVKNIFSVSTLDKDQIMLKFPDTKSGNIPRGIYRIWHRVGNGKTYDIKTTDVVNKKISYTYRTTGQSKDQSSTLTMKFSLQYQVSNAQSAETIDQIKNRAPQLYYTQNRFINGEDYNIAPLMMGNTVLKAKAINRIYSGQSRFIDINDPTGKYQNVDVFSDDGAIYRDASNAMSTRTVLLPTTKTNTSITLDDIEPLFSSVAVIQRYQEYPANNVTATVTQTWNSEYNSVYASDTYGTMVDIALKPIEYPVGTVLNFNISGESVWSSVVSVSDDGKMVLSTSIPSGSSLLSYIIAFRTKLSTTEVQSIAAVLDKKTDFSLWYKSSTQTWEITQGPVEGIETTVGGVTSPIFVKASYNSEAWNFTSYGVNYVFVGGSKVKFYFVSQDKVSDISSGTVNVDKISVLAYNDAPTVTTGYVKDNDFKIVDTITQDNGYMDGSRAVLSCANTDDNGVPLNPTAFRDVVPLYTGVDKTKYEQLLFFKANDDFTIEYIETPSTAITILDSTWVYTAADANRESIAYRRQALLDNIAMRSSSISALYSKNTGFIINFVYNGVNYFVRQTTGNNNDRLSSMVGNLMVNTDASVISPETAFYRAIVNTNSPTALESAKLAYYGYEDVSSTYFIKNDARRNINFHWKHYAPDDNRIDPSKTNIIDMFVLTNSYKEEVQIWVQNADGSDFPKAPTSTDLKDIFSDVETKISVSDSIIWHSARYLPLFGPSADDSHKASFKVVKLPTSTYSDDEIRQAIITLINQYFDVSLWDFGESFYFTGLCTYITQQLSSEVASVVIVPQDPTSKFGQLFEIPCDSDQIFVSTATVDNVAIVNSLAKTNINIGS